MARTPRDDQRAPRREPQRAAERESATSTSEPTSFISPEELTSLVEVMLRYDVTELTHARGVGAARQRITIRRGAQGATSHVAPPPVFATQIAHATPVSSGHSPASAPAAAPAAEEGVFFVTSPLVGTFYRAPTPDGTPFVEVGAKIRPGQRLCIVEAMKLMNEIEAEVEGSIVEILVENGKPVEYGQKLFKVRK